MAAILSRGRWVDTDFTQVGSSCIMHSKDDAHCSCFAVFSYVLSLMDFFVSFQVSSRALLLWSDNGIRIHIFFKSLTHFRYIVLEIISIDLSNGSLGSHGSLFSGKVLTFEHGSIDTAHVLELLCYANFHPKCKNHWAFLNTCEVQVSSFE